MLEQQLRELIKSYRRADRCGCDYPCSCGSLDAGEVADRLEKLLPKEGTMITAEEARKRINDKVKIQARAWLEEAEAKITKAIANSQYYCSHTFHEALYETVKAELEKFGYCVSRQGGGCGGGAVTTQISWSKPCK